MRTGQADRRAALYALLGELPPREAPIGSRLHDEIDRGAYVVQRLTLDLNGQEDVPAYFALPKDADGRLPTILYNHAHGGDYELGKDELLLGRKALQTPAYVDVFAAEGYAVLCIDTWLFGERRGRSESELFKQMLWDGRVLWGMMVYDSLRAIDYLTTRPDVDANRIGTLGLSMGSTMAWWVAALDPRVKVCVDLCCLTDYQALIESRGLDGHGIYYYVPSLLKHFTTSDINALIAPRPHLSLAGDFDPLTPSAGLERIDDNMRRVYAELGAPDAWQLRRYATGHFETVDMRRHILAFLRKWL